MQAGRVALVVTCVVVAGLTGWFAMARWDEANKVAAVLSALGAVAAVGVAVWAALRGVGSGVRVRRTGRARAATHGNANTGVVDKAGRGGSVQVARTGDADAGGGGNANTGAELD